MLLSDNAIELKVELAKQNLERELEKKRKKEEEKKFASMGLLKMPASMAVIHESPSVGALPLIKEEEKYRESSPARIHQQYKLLTPLQNIEKGRRKSNATPVLKN